MTYVPKDVARKITSFYILFLIFILYFILSIQVYSRDIFKKNYGGKIVNHKLDETKLSPSLKNGNNKYKIALIQSDDYSEYYNSFMAILDGLKTLGWLEKNQLTDKNKYTKNREILKAWNNNFYSNYITIDYEDFFSFRASKENRNKKKYKNIIQNCKDGKYDLVIVLGTLASKEVLRDKEYKTNTLLEAVSDPLGSKLIKSENDSGYEFLTARVDPNQYLRQIRLFYEVVKFEKLGIIYENSENGRWYAAVDAVEKVADEYGFEIIRSHKAMAEPTVAEYPKAFKMYLDALDEVCPKVDAVFLGISGGLEAENLPNIVKKLIKYKTASFSMEGETAVEKGIMLGVSGKETGLYNAKKIAKILNGESPRNLKQNFEKEPKISINLKTAELIEKLLPTDIIRSSDQIYVNIEED